MPEDPQSLPGRKTSTCKGPEVGMSWRVEGKAQAGMAGEGHPGERGWGLDSSCRSWGVWGRVCLGCTLRWRDRETGRESERLGEGRGASTSHTFQQVQELIQLPQRSCLSLSSLRSRPPE